MRTLLAVFGSLLLAIAATDTMASNRNPEYRQAASARPCSTGETPVSVKRMFARDRMYPGSGVGNKIIPSLFSFFDVLQWKLGLRLQSMREMLDLESVDRAERPSEN